MSRIRIVLVAFVLVAMLAPPAAAAHRLELTHVAQPVALAGQDLTLAVGLQSSCSVFCSPVRISVTYQATDGRTRVVHAWTGGSLKPAAVVTLTIPGADVRGPDLRYVLRAYQHHCMPFGGSCHTATTQAPATGAYTVAVAGG
jgi:hypothetical protein